MRKCTVDGCNKKHFAKDLCHYHYNKSPAMVAYMKQYHFKHYRTNAAYRERRKISSTASWLRLKTEVYHRYGGAKCACCGETEPAFLQLDHIDGGGSAHRKSLGGRNVGPMIYQDLKRKGFPPGYQILCANCNFGKQLRGGICPHKIPKVSLASN